VSEQKLDLFQLAAGFMTKAGASPSQIMWSDVFQSAGLGSPPDDRPDNFRIDSVAPDLISSVHCSENRTSCDPRCSGPSVHRSLHPARDRHGSDVPAFSEHIRQKPLAISLIEVPHRDRGQLRTA